MTGLPPLASVHVGIALGGTIKATENERIAVDDRTFRWSRKKPYPNNTCGA